MFIRPELPADISAIRIVHQAAFPAPTEARLVELLRERGKATVSLVADLGGVIVGHELFSPVIIDSTPQARGLGLGPVAVLPSHQRQGIGARLILDGLEACRLLGVPFVVVLGEPTYYHRFGFARASALGLTNEYGVDDPFMILVLDPDSLPKTGGLIRYAPEFAQVVA